MKNSSDIIENRTRDLTACSAVPQPNAPSRAPYCKVWQDKWQICAHKTLSYQPKPEAADVSVYYTRCSRGRQDNRENKTQNKLKHDSSKYSDHVQLHLTGSHLFSNMQIFNSPQYVSCNRLYARRFGFLVSTITGLNWWKLNTTCMCCVSGIDPSTFVVSYVQHKLLTARAADRY
jgi:hypothetical protein